MTVSDGATLDLSELGAEIHVTSIDGTGTVIWGTSALCVCKGRTAMISETQSVSRLRLDLTAEEDGVLSVFTPASAGTLELVKAGTGSVKGRDLPFKAGAFGENADEILKGWSVTVDGRPLGNARVVITEGGGLGVIACPGLSIIIR